MAMLDGLRRGQGAARAGGRFRLERGGARVGLVAVECERTLVGCRNFPAQNFLRAEMFSALSQSVGPTRLVLESMGQKEKQLVGSVWVSVRAWSGRPARADKLQLRKAHLFRSLSSHKGSGEAVAPKRSAPE